MYVQVHFSGGQYACAGCKRIAHVRTVSTGIPCRGAVGTALPRRPSWRLTFACPDAVVSLECPPDSLPATIHLRRCEQPALLQSPLAACASQRPVSLRDADAQSSLS